MKPSATLHCWVLAFLVWMQIGLPVQALAHGTGHRMLPDAPVVAIAFHYSDMTPMRYAEVLVFSPHDPKVEFQNGRTDRNGNFVFYPDAEGQWRIRVHDGMGHLEETAVEIGPQETGGENQMPTAFTSSASMGKTLKVFTGVSLILNLCFAINIVKRRRIRRKAYQPQ